MNIFVPYFPSITAADTCTISAQDSLVLRPWCLSLQIFIAEQPLFNDRHPYFTLPETCPAITAYTILYVRGFCCLMIFNFATFSFMEYINFPCILSVALILQTCSIDRAVTSQKRVLLENFWKKGRGKAEKREKLERF